jgi:hypothetical protein
VFGVRVCTAAKSRFAGALFAFSVNKSVPGSWADRASAGAAEFSWEDSSDDEVETEVGF